MPFVDFLDEHAGMGEIIARRIDALRPFSAMAEAIMRGSGSFTAAECELLGAYVSAANDCSFCFNSHAATARALGVDAALLEAMVEDLDTAPVAAKLKPVLRYVKKLTDAPYKMVQSDADAVYRAGWNDRALSDAVLICGLFNMANRVVEGHGVSKELPAELFEAGAERMSEHGYLPPDMDKNE
ncbi:MAG: peroxidase-related enzyme [Gammaproteobacteria bacterium]|nr:peroxidase-related enzyme [Gammaproteobacteria bacterium]NNM01391.1 peroxidase-related enzyme [Gammaproteobacteria bacterium]